jgi:hypothetical protein
MSESTQLLELRGRMAAWDRSFVEGHGRHPTEWEWASAARVVGRLPCAEADRLARELYGAYGDEAAEVAARDEFSAFAETLVARQARRRAMAMQADDSRAFVRTAVPIVLAGAAIAVWAAGRGRGKLAA